MNPENNPEFSVKGMALAGRPELRGQKKMPLGGRPEPGWIAIGSHAAQRAPGLMCGALLNRLSLERELPELILQEID